MIPFNGNNSYFKITSFCQELREYSVSELHSVDAEMTKLEVEDPLSNASSTCSYHSKGGFGHATRGVRSDTGILI